MKDMYIGEEEIKFSLQVTFIVYVGNPKRKRKKF